MGFLSVFFIFFFGVLCTFVALYFNAFHAFDLFLKLRRSNQKHRFELSDPIEAGVLLVVGVASLGGRMTAQTKRDIMTAFQRGFGISSKRSRKLVNKAYFSHLDLHSFPNEIQYILAPSINVINESHTATLMSLLNRVADLDAPPTMAQRDVIQKIDDYLLHGVVNIKSNVRAA